MITAVQLRRRRLRFSLRTLFVLTTLVAVWLGWNQHVVQRRLAARALILQDGGVVFVRRDCTALPIGPDGKPAFARGLMYDLIDSEPSVPWVRRLLGDETVDLVMLRSGIENGMAQKEVSLAFPEADILTTGPFSEYLEISLRLAGTDP
jgi:hypothetical protein